MKKSFKAVSKSNNVSEFNMLRHSRIGIHSLQWVKRATLIILDFIVAVEYKVRDAFLTFTRNKQML